MNSMYERLKQVEARANAATPGPWEAGCNDRHVLYVTTENEEFCAEYGPELYDSQGFFSDDDTEFIAHSRTDMPDMAAALRAVLARHACIEPSLEQEREQGMRDWCGECDTFWPCPTVQEIEEALGR